jgi:hypothetical protein
MAKRKISRASTIVEILFTIIVTVVLVFRPSIIGVSLNGSPFVPMLNADRLNTYIIGIVLLGLICLGILVWKIYISLLEHNLWLPQMQVATLPYVFSCCLW